MPTPSVFQRETVIDAGIDAVYAFHENPFNIGSISPSWQKVRGVSAQKVACVGETFTIDVTLAGVIPMRWGGIWREARRPTLLIDELVTGPFAFWRHSHAFKSLGPGETSMIDRVEYGLPGGLLGRLFAETFGRLQLHWMFQDRQARTRNWLRDQK